MTAAELINQIMALPTAERAAIAQMLWESIEDEEVVVSPDSEVEAIKTVERRDRELSHGEVRERCHDDVVKNARPLLECDQHGVRKPS